MRIFSKSIRNKLIFSIMLFSIIILLANGMILYHLEKREVREHTFHEIESIKEIQKQMYKTKQTSNNENNKGFKLGMTTDKKDDDFTSF